MKKQPGEWIVGLDCSTTAVKAVAFDRTGSLQAEVCEPLSLHSPGPNLYEQDPEEWWAAGRKVLRKLAREVGAGRIQALAVSNQRETFAALDRDGKSLRPAITWLDERCREMVEPFSKKIGPERIHRITGKPVDYAPVAYRLAWMKKYEPHLYKKISMIVDVQSWMVWKMTGAFRTSWASADPLGLFDMKKKKWSGVILKALGLDEDRLPSLFPPGSLLGIFSEAAAGRTGLQAGTPVIAGGGDGQAAALGTNSLIPERAYLNLGTAVVLGIYGTEYKTSKAFRTLCACSESGYVYECSLRAGTFAIDWFIRHILKIDPAGKTGIYGQLEKEAMEVPSGSGGCLFLPYLCGVMNPYWDSRARAAFIGLSSSHHRGHLYRAILEGIAFEQRFALEAVEKVTGNRIGELAVTGGGSASELWCRILSDVTGRKILLPETIGASALGAGILSAVGAGWYASSGEAAKKMTHVKKTLYPDMKIHEAYQAVFKMFKKLYPTLINR